MRENVIVRCLSQYSGVFVGLLGPGTSDCQRLGHPSISWDIPRCPRVFLGLLGPGTNDCQSLGHLRISRDVPGNKGISRISQDTWWQSWTVVQAQRAVTSLVLPYTLPITIYTYGMLIIPFVHRPCPIFHLSCDETLPASLHLSFCKLGGLLVLWPDPTHKEEGQVTQAQILGLASELPMKLLSGNYWIHVQVLANAIVMTLWCDSLQFAFLHTGFCKPSLCCQTSLVLRPTYCFRLHEGCAGPGIFLTCVTSRVERW